MSALSISNHSPLPITQRRRNLSGMEVRTQVRRRNVSFEAEQRVTHFRFFLRSLLALGGYPTDVDTRYPFYYASAFMGQACAGGNTHCSFDFDGSKHGCNK